MSRAEFERWYWPVASLQQFCEALGLPASGLKDELRKRVARRLEGEEAETTPRRRLAKSRFNWSSSSLTPETPITDNISFGPNVRGFFKRTIGSGFVCHGDFMAWVKANAGRTLNDAVEAWWMLEARKDDPAFRREIAACNNYLQYLRDFRDANPALDIDQAKTCWDAKKIRPARDGRVEYEVEDLRFLES
ncbi:MAG: DUF6434 domain-containing protein [Pseudomonadota bacterium]